MATIAVIIPCYKVRKHILDLIGRIGPEVTMIFCVDDDCPELSGRYIEEHCTDKRVRVFKHTENRGVGGAVITGYRAALEANADILVKCDGDGQMDPALIPKLIRPIADLTADYTKGNRFYLLDFVATMPFRRKIGNAVLSFMNKFSTGYWDIFDPTNGFAAIAAQVARQLPLDGISGRYFFESDMLFRLSIIRAVVRDVPMRAIYRKEESGLRIRRILLPFLVGHARNLLKRLFYNYYLRGFSAGSIELLLALILLPFGVSMGLVEWSRSIATGRVASSGTVMLAALPIILGFQLLLSFIAEDIQNLPRTPISPNL